MFSTKCCCVVFLTAAITACSGGGDSTSATSYSFAVPQVGSQRIYDRTIVDNSSNTINETVRETTTAQNSDGSYTYVQDDPNHDSITVNGTTYAVTTEDITANDSGQTVFYSYTPTGGSLTTCTLDPHGVGPNYPVVIGPTFSTDFTETCGASAPISYSQSGSIVDVESVTVPAGTYTAVKVQSTLTWTTSNGTIHTKTTTNWRNASDGHSVKSVENLSYSGTPPTNGYPVTVTAVLQSQS